MFGHRMREIVVAQCKCMENQDREWNEAKFLGRGSQNKDYKAGGDAEVETHC